VKTGPGKNSSGLTLLQGILVSQTLPTRYTWVSISYQLIFIFKSNSNSIDMYYSNQYNITTNKCTIVFWCSLITGYYPTCFSHLCGHLHRGTNKNTVTITKVSEPFHHWK
jgi:hypothetical protein